MKLIYTYNIIQLLLRNINPHIFKKIKIIKKNSIYRIILITKELKKHDSIKITMQYDEEKNMTYIENFEYNNILKNILYKKLIDKIFNKTESEHITSLFNLKNQFDYIMFYANDYGYRLIVTKRFKTKTFNFIKLKLDNIFKNLLIRYNINEYEKIILIWN